MTLNSKILQYLAENKISQAKVAMDTGIAQQNLSRLLNSEDMKLSQLQAITKSLDLPITYFFDGKENVENDEIEGYKKRIKELELSAALNRFYKVDKYVTEAKKVLEYGYRDLSPEVKEKVLNEIFDNAKNYKDFADDIVSHLLLDISDFSKSEIRDGIDEMVKKHSKE